MVSYTSTFLNSNLHIWCPVFTMHLYYSVCQNYTCFYSSVYYMHSLKLLESNCYMISYCSAVVLTPALHI